MKTIEQARKNIKTLKEMYNDWDGRDNEVLKSINKMIIMECEFIRDKEHDFRLKAYDEAKKAINECLDMFKDIKQKKYIYLVFTDRNILVGCFDTKEKAKNYAGFTDCNIIKQEVI